MTYRRVEAKPARRVVRCGRVTVSCERSAIDREQAEAFAALAARGIREVERLAGRTSRAILRFELRTGTRISTARGRTIHLPVYRIAARTAPYLHEIVHALLPCRHAPPWFSEGLACYLECVVSERGAGYDSRLFTPDGNPGVHADAARWLADPRGQKVLPFIGTRGTPERIVADRHNVAAPFYVLAHSLLKFLTDQVGLPPVIRLAHARSFTAGIRRLTGKPASAWRNDWLQRLRPLSPP